MVAKGRGQGSKALGPTQAANTLGWTHFTTSVGLGCDEAGWLLVADASLQLVRVFNTDGRCLAELTAAAGAPHPGWMP